MCPNTPPSPFAPKLSKLNSSWGTDVCFKTGRAASKWAELKVVGPNAPIDRGTLAAWCNSAAGTALILQAMEIHLPHMRQAESCGQRRSRSGPARRFRRNASTLTNVPALPASSPCDSSSEDTSPSASLRTPRPTSPPSPTASGADARSGRCPPRHSPFRWPARLPR